MEMLLSGSQQLLLQDAGIARRIVPRVCAWRSAATRAETSTTILLMVFDMRLVLSELQLLDPVIGLRAAGAETHAGRVAGAHVVAENRWKICWNARP